MLLHVAGALGPVLLLGAYLGLSLGRLSATSVAYQVMNLVGSIILILYSYVLGAWVSVALNVVWAAIAMAAMARMAAGRR